MKKTNKKKILIITGNRSEYDLLKPLIIELKKQKNIKTFTLATGSHLSKKYGFTYKKILQDKIPIDKKINLNIHSDKKNYLIKYFSLGLTKFFDYTKKLNPDLAIVLGDRYEVFAFTISCYILNIPIAHIHGGEVTQGSVDDGFRHSITKMSNLHFVSHNNYKKRVIQLGESPKNVFLVGALGVENIFNTKILKKKHIEKKLKIRFLKKNLIISYHPETASQNSVKSQYNELLSAIKSFKKINFIFTSPNGDPGSNAIILMTKNFVKKNKNAYYVPSMGKDLFFSCIKYSDGIVGNSSSGIIEFPALKKRTINIGNRQKGRIKANSVIDTLCVRSNITTAINKLYSQKVKNKTIKINNPFKKKHTSKLIVSIIKKKFKKEIEQKKLFHDIKF
tara:strand:- start:325 stop:1500 length:1176 start_codon:yes stop_codon:yes gene_type:complete